MVPLPPDSVVAIVAVRLTGMETEAMIRSPLSVPVAPVAQSKNDLQAQYPKWLETLGVRVLHPGLR
ncbi:hypothetical protein [Okeania sp. SIO2G5]|uniref:hypothetical protein n=1 Tax=Okeania sp. SIO2G5 TaxID=2607796 RepID=UPI0013BF7DE1|nr:hypothetical protein [Okeania sp. SIO2G5]NEP76395.1 hypothetical protein [Okeania sp. SIO2G5]